jgi:hypothetical protein
MSRRPQTPTRDFEEIAYSIGVIADLVHEDIYRKACEESEPFLSDFELGGLMTAVKQLSTRGRVKSPR